MTISGQHTENKEGKMIEIVDIRIVKNLARGHFFSAGATRFFSSHYSQIAYYQPQTDCYFFVSSEQFDSKTPRRYTVRRLNLSGGVDTIGDFQQYETSRQAHKAARQAAEKGS